MKTFLSVVDARKRKFLLDSESLHLFIRKYVLFSSILCKNSMIIFIVGKLSKNIRHPLGYDNCSYKVDECWQSELLVSQNCLTNAYFQ